MCFGPVDEGNSRNARAANTYPIRRPPGRSGLLMRTVNYCDSWCGIRLMSMALRSTYMTSKMWLYLIMNSRLGRPGKLKLSSVSL